MKKSFLPLLSLIIFSSSSFGQDTYPGKFKFIPLPVVAANPSNGWMFGLAPGANWYMGDPASTNISSGLGTFIYTTKKQWIITAKTNVFTRDNAWNLLGDWRFFVTSQPTYGLGTGPQSAKPIGTGITFGDNPYEPIEDAQMMNFNYLRLHETFMKNIEGTSFYVGLGYHLDYHYNIDDNLLNLDSNVVTSHYAYSKAHDFDPEKYTLSGVSVNLLYDSRDNAINPYKGRYAFANLRMNPKWMGSSQSSSILWLEYRDYIHLSKTRPRHLIGFWGYGWFVTGGDVPYLDLPAVGWDQFGRSGRAYTQGRFRGEDMIYTEVEYRFPLTDKEKWGGVLFVNGTTASNRDGNIGLYQYLDPGYGFGLRYMFDEKSRTNIDLDFAFGNYGANFAFYFGINEVF